MKKITLIFIIFLLQASAAVGAIYYVSTTGDDSSNGTSELTSWAHHPDDTNATGVSDAKVLTAGDIVKYLPGNYYDVYITTADNGTSENSITITSSTANKSDVKLYSSYDPSTLSWSADGTCYKTGSNVTTEPKVVMYNDILLTLHDGVTTSVASNEWDWDSNVLYVNVGDDPSLGNILVGKRDNSIYLNTNYYTISYITLGLANSASGACITNNQKAGLLVQEVNINGSAGYGVYANLNTAYNSTEIIGGQFKNIKSTNTVVYVRGVATSIFKITGTEIIGGGTGIAPSSGDLISEITNCTIHSVTTIGIYLISGNGHRVTGCTIYNIGTSNNSGVYGISILSNNNYIYNNAISSIRRMGIGISGNSNTIDKNDISLCGYMSSSYPYSYPTSLMKYGSGGAGAGISIGGTSSANKITRNKLYSSFQGIQVQTTGGTGGSIISFNLSANQIVNGIGVYSDANPTNRNWFKHNVIYHNPSPDNSTAYIGHGLHAQDVSAGGIKAGFANNIVYNVAPSTNSHCLMIGDNGGLNSVYLDHNIYYMLSGSVNVSFLGTTYTNLATFKTAVQSNAKMGDLTGNQVGAEAHSLFSDPLLTDVSNFDGYPTSKSPTINAGGNTYVNGDGDQYDLSDVKIWDDVTDLPVGPWANGVEIGAYGFVASGGSKVGPYLYPGAAKPGN